MKTGESFTIGELAEETGVTARTIRYYVAEGLLPAPGGTGQQRIYGREHLVRLRLIRRLQEEHLPLKEIQARVGRLSVAEMERLLDAAPRARRRVDPRRLLRAVLRPEADQSADEDLDEEPLLLREMVPGAPAPAPATPGLWRRVLLAPGVELHYEASDDPYREAAIQEIIADAGRRLALE